MGCPCWPRNHWFAGRWLCSRGGGYGNSGGRCSCRFGCHDRGGYCGRKCE